MTTYEKVKRELQNNPKTWLITGVAGFIGSNLLETLLKLNQNVVGLDNFETGFQRNIDQAIACAADALGADNRLLDTASFTFIEGDNRINTSDHIAPNADCNCPHQCHSRATFPIPNPADKEKESDINIKQGNNSPWIIQ